MTTTRMVLVSIHPFALRRLFLVVLALTGFSALCFGDPVLMAHRYGQDKARAVDAHSRVANGAPAGPSTSSWDPMVSRNFSCDWPVETFYDNLNDFPLLTASKTE